MSAQATIVEPDTQSGTLGPNGTPNVSAENPPAPSISDPLASLREELDKANHTLATLTRERQITRALFEAGAMDLDITTVLIERELAAHPKADPAALVDELAKRKPLLFRRSPPPEPVKAKPPTGPIRTSVGVLSAMAARTPPADPFAHAAQAAAHTGNRASLLAYMRLKRQPAD